ncbi:hypothetical protein [Streptomyces mexicanus]|uniref:hypothetical protein n=1 Tax=Streptomyces mexicanus TaxID=178566 RepID=UPI0031F13F5F
MSAFPILRRDDVAAATSQPGLVLLDFWQASCAMHDGREVARLDGLIREADVDKALQEHRRNGR